MLVNATKNINWEQKNHALRLGNVSKDFTINNMKKKKTESRGIVNFFYINPIDTNDILDIHKYLMKGTWYKNVLVDEENIYWIILFSLFG